MHGSSISLVSTASSLYSSAEEKQAHEIRKLRRELTEAQEKVHTLTSQLSTNVSRFIYFSKGSSTYNIIRISLFEIELKGDQLRKITINYKTCNTFINLDRISYKT